LSRRQLGAPDPKFLAVSAAIGNILHLTGRGKIIENLIEDFDDAGSFLAHNGGTDIEALLSISRLSLWSPGRNAINREFE
jgi:hypothetical protein